MDIPDGHTDKHARLREKFLKTYKELQTPEDCKVNVAFNPLYISQSIGELVRIANFFRG